MSPKIIDHLADFHHTNSIPTPELAAGVTMNFSFSLFRPGWHPTQVRCVIGLYAGVTCCIHKLIGTLIVILTCSSTARISLPLCEPARVTWVTIRSLAIIYHIAVMWGNIQQARHAAFCGCRRARRHQRGPPTDPLCSPLNMDGRRSGDQCHPARVCDQKRLRQSHMKRNSADGWGVFRGKTRRIWAAGLNLLRRRGPDVKVNLSNSLECHAPTHSSTAGLFVGQLTNLNRCLR